MSKQKIILQAMLLGTLIIVTVLTHTPVMAAEGITYKMASYLLNRQCQSQISESALWQKVGIFLNEEQKGLLMQRVCTCVAQQASEQLDFQDVVKLIDPAQRRQRIESISVQTIVSCAKQALKH